MPTVQVQTKRIWPSIHHIKCDFPFKKKKIWGSSSMGLLFLFHPVKQDSKPQIPRWQKLAVEKVFHFDLA